MCTRVFSACTPHAWVVLADVRREPDPLELELQTVVSNHIDALNDSSSVSIISEMGSHTMRTRLALLEQAPMPSLLVFLDNMFLWFSSD